MTHSGETDGPARAPRRIDGRFAGLSLLIVGALVLLSAGRMSVLYAWRGLEVPFPDLLASAALDWGLWLPLAAFAWWLAGRAPLGGRPLVRASRIGVHLLASVLCSLAQLAAFALASHALAPSARGLEEALRSAALVKLHAGVLVYWALVLARHAVEAARRARAADVARIRLDERLACARLEVLQAHLRPHFLFNTLNAVAALMRRDPDEAEAMLVRLGDLLRRSLTDAEEARVTLGSELDFLERYTAIERARFGARLELHVNVTPECRAAQVPRLLLQPLVENAIQHGVAPHPGGGRVDVRGSRDGTHLVVVVEDRPRRAPAAPATAARDEQGARGMGLKGTREQLAILYGERAHLSVERRDHGGTRVRLALPFEHEVRAPRGLEGAA